MDQLYQSYFDSKKRSKNLGTRKRFFNDNKSRINLVNLEQLNISQLGCSLGL